MVAPVAAGPRPDPARGVFETMLILGRRPVELGAHLDRMSASLDALFGLAAPTGLAELVAVAARELPRGRLRLDVAPGRDGALEASVRTAPVGAGEVLPHWEHGATLAAITVEDGLGAHKWADRRLLETAEHGAEPAVPLLLDGCGLVLEASRANVFVIEHGTVVTPIAGGRILPGITRARTLTAARRLGLATLEEDVPLDRLLESDEVFLTGSVRGIEPVRGVEQMREWRAGDVTPRLAAELGRWWML